MPRSAAHADVTPVLDFCDVLSDDGTHLRAWTNDPDGVIDGPTVVLCNGLGANPLCWPALLRPDCGVRVVSWNHRGVGGSDRPADPSNIAIENFVEDGLSIMDHFDIESAVLMGWSMGVNTMFELAARHPERVLGLFAVAGAPGDTFATMLAPLRLPHSVARGLTVNFSRVMSLATKALTPVARRVPVGPKVIAVLSHSGFMLPLRDPELAEVAIKEFLTTPLDWYFHLALATSGRARVRVSRIDVPAFFVAGSFDVLAGARDMASAASRVKDGTYVELRGTHFVQMEQPEVVHQLLLDFLERIG